MIETLRFILCALLIGLGLIFEICAVIGVFRFHYVLNRMHAAAMGDTLGIMLCMVGLIILCGLNFISLKMALVVVFLWFASPVASHTLARFEVATNEELEKDCELPNSQDDKQ